MLPKYAFALLAAFAVTLAACGKKGRPRSPPPPQLPRPFPPRSRARRRHRLDGHRRKAIGADKKVTAATDAFAKGDTFYASVETTARVTPS